MAQALDLSLTGRDVGLPERVPMVGVPQHALDGYIARLVEKGYKVALSQEVDKIRERGTQKSSGTISPAAQPNTEAPPQPFPNLGKGSVLPENTGDSDVSIGEIPEQPRPTVAPKSGYDVDVVGYTDKAHICFAEKCIHKVSDLRNVPSESIKVFYNNGTHSPCFYIPKHGVPTLAVKIDTAHPFIYVVVEFDTIPSLVGTGVVQIEDGFGAVRYFRAVS